MLKGLPGIDFRELTDRDGDLATHLVRTESLRSGERLTDVTQHLCRAAGVRSRVLPMADAPRRTDIECEGETLPFQRWFVEQRAVPPVRGVHFIGASVPTPKTPRSRTRISRTASEIPGCGVSA